MIKLSSKIYVAGHNGLVGSAIVRKLLESGYKNIITVNKKNLDLTDQKKVFNFLRKKKPSAIIIAAAKVGGIKANNEFKADFIYQNLSIQNNLIHGAYINGIKNLIFLGSSCIYPRDIKKPLKEEYILNGPLEKTNEPYSIAKIAGIKLCESYNYQHNTNYKCLMPCNTYGPNDNYDLSSSHFFPAMIRKVHEAKIKNKKKIILWGSGKSMRELIYVDDIAEACIFFLKKKTSETVINIGSSFEMTIKQYAKFVINFIDPKIKITLDKSKLNGTFRKILSNNLSRKYGWKSKISLKEGLKLTYRDFLKRKIS